MPRNGSGQYTVPAGTFAVTDTDISSSAYNTFLADVSAALTNSVNVQGTAPMLAAFNAGGFVMSNLAPGVAQTDGATLAQAQQAVPSGAVQFFAMSTPPTGWLEANGASMSTTSFATLFAAIGFTFGGSGASFNIPDLRGRFLRGWDHGAGIDVSGAVAQVKGFFAGTAFTVSSVIAGTIAVGQVLTGPNVSPVTIQSGSGTAWVTNAAQTVGSAGAPITVTASTGAARVFGSFQADANASHTHIVSQTAHTHTISDPTHTHGAVTGSHNHGISDPTHAHTVSGVATISGQVQGAVSSFNGAAATTATTSAVGTGITINTVGNIGVTVTGAATGVTNVANNANITNVFQGLPEVTVKNTALLPCIKM